MCVPHPISTTANGFSAQDQRCHPAPDQAGLPWLPPQPAPTSTPSPIPENLSPSESLRTAPPGVFQLLLLPPLGARRLFRPQAALPALPLAPTLAPLLPPGTSWTEGQSPGEGGPVLSAPRWATEAAETHPRQRCLGNLPDELRGLSIPLWRILESQSPPPPPPSHHQEPYLCYWPFKSRAGAGFWGETAQISAICIRAWAREGGPPQPRQDRGIGRAGGARH